MAIAPEFFLPLFFRATRANRTFLSVDAARERMAERALHPTSFGAPRGLRRDILINVTHRHGWPVYRITPAVGASRGTVIYAHGGAWVNEVALQHWQLAAQLAAEAQVAVDLVIYPLVPFGTAADVVATFVQLVLENRREFGATVLAGDSAGGQIALSAALQLRNEHAVTLARTVLISPSVDLTFTNPQIPAVQPSDPWLAVPGGIEFARHWAGELDIHDPVVSPLFGELSGLGPITLFTGTRDILNPDARLLAAKVAAAGVQIDVHEVHGQLHVYPLLPTRTGRDARRQLVDAVRAATDPDVDAPR
ncbi:MAG: alpha/beta hydrolase [Pseudolysinimonas sp.]